ncbi:mitotic fidelity of chromosome transmission-related protein [Madurella fahalii]|uniref:Mitotic fidelity of chromosome transmission-related protein n=1 Tax=Madurella fahalii TaxID=1157608 RepID=A0ABQ0G7B1_9PEZI
MAPAPRASAAPRRATQAEHIYELGVVGRKTGVTVPDSGVRDEHGMEPLENLFSSPGKSDYGGEEDDMVSDDDDGNGEEAMDITTTSGIGPAALLNGHGSRLPMPLSRVKSPVKTLLKSPAQRNRLIARSSSSPARGAIVRDNAEKSSSQPVRDQAATKRRLDFRSVESGGPHSLSQPTRGLTNGHRLQPLHQDSDEGSEQDAEHDEVNDFVEESMAMLSGGDDYDISAQSELHPAASESGEPEEEVSAAEEESAHAPIAQKKRGRPPKQKEAPPAKRAKAPKKPVRPVVEEDDVEDQQEEDEPPADEVPKKRRGLPKAGKATAVEQPPARGSKKRRSLNEEESAGPAGPSPQPQPKRQRTDPAANSKKPATKQPAALGKKNAEQSSTAKGPRGRKRKSSIDPGDVSQVMVARRPPLPKSRGLLINRREVPGDSGAIIRTRSGRNSFKPLAYWRNERVDYEKDEAEDAYSGRTHRSRFVLPSIKEVVRVDEPEPEFRPKSRKGKKGGGGGGGGRGRRKSRGYASDDDDGGGPADLWELDPGTVTGEVVVWQPEYEFSPPAPNDLVSVMDKQLAISGAAIKTTEVVGGEFRYAKVFSEGFIGAGVVDLPPGAMKRLKNSRKVFMIFFVHYGRVLVTVQETSFRISKGGIFIVPRYNEYTIENDYDHPARIFFSQGQETTARPPPEEEAEDNEHAEDEEVDVSEGEEEGSGEED